MSGDGEADRGVRMTMEARRDVGGWGTSRVFLLTGWGGGVVEGRFMERAGEVTAGRDGEASLEAEGGGGLGGRGGLLAVDSRFVL